MAYRFVPGRPFDIGANLLALIGNTPLVPVRRIGDVASGVEVYAKLEGHNPGGSVKDRPVLRIIEDAERDGRLTRDRIILDSTSGNAGIAYAMIGAAKGYHVTLVAPRNISDERKGALYAYRARLLFTDALEGSDGAMLEARRLAAAEPTRYVYLDQYDNPSNWRAHYDGTGPEIIAQTHGRVSHFVAGVGTTGTLVGVGRRLRETDPTIEIIAVEPDDGFHGIEGLKHLPTAITPGIYDPAVSHRTVRVSSNDAYAMTRRLAAEEGILAGPSSGAAMAAAIQVAAKLDHAVIVVIFPDRGDRYLSTNVWRVGAAAPYPRDRTPAES